VVSEGPGRRRIGEQGVHKTVVRKAMAQEFTPADLSPSFRSNGTDVPDNPRTRRWRRTSFADWQLKVDGLVEKPREFSLAELRALPSRTQITRHDCVEGWSAIGKWKGARLARCSRRQAEARGALRRVPLRRSDGRRRHEPVLREHRHRRRLPRADHPRLRAQRPALPVGNGAPIRLRVERQLGYKQAKYIMRLRARRELRDDRRRQRADTGKTRDTTGTPASRLWMDTEPAPIVHGPAGRRCEMRGSSRPHRRQGPAPLRGCAGAPAAQRGTRNF
jgi:DMSO/TMAO reductase YedYZ molybdopterin-dependent catalytic subunit